MFAARNMTFAKASSDPLAGITLALRLQTHNGNNVPLGLYTDTACTTAATTAGDLIAAWKDELSGGGIIFTQATSANRPTLQFDSGVPVIDFDGADDFLEYTSTNIAVDRRTAVVGCKSNTLTGGTIMQFRRSGVGYLLRQFNSGTSIGGDVSLTNQDTAVPPSAITNWHTATWYQDASRNTSYRYNGVGQTVTGNPPNAETGLTGSVIGSAFNAINFQVFPGRMTSIIVAAGELPIGETQTIEAYCDGLNP